MIAQASGAYGVLTVDMNRRTSCSPSRPMKEIRGAWRRLGQTSSMSHSNETSLGDHVFAFADAPILSESFEASFRN